MDPEGVADAAPTGGGATPGVDPGGSAAGDEESFRLTGNRARIIFPDLPFHVPW